MTKILSSSNIDTISDWIGLFFIASCFKLLLIHTYASTDFDVHRNWLAITFRLSPQCWYFDSTSEWTLDYPPLFAYYEAALSRIASLFDTSMLELTAVPIRHTRILLFQRFSVLLSDVLLLVGVKRLVHTLFSVDVVASGGVKLKEQLSRTRALRLAVAALVVLNFALLLVDHIHFQYNGVLLGLLLLSIDLAARRRFLLATVSFALLINAKHLFITLGPVIACYYLKFYIFNNNNHTNNNNNNTNNNSNNKQCENNSSEFVPRIVRVVVRTVVVVFLLASTTVLLFAPLLTSVSNDGSATCARDNTSTMVAFRQILSRLFPFDERGLVHAYWAPNAWSLYSGADLVLARLLRRRVGASLTSGRVELDAQRMAVLPDVRPLHCAVLTLLAMLPPVYRICKSGAQTHAQRAYLLTRSVAHASLAAFWFGWHVHEKAILVTLIPLTLVAFQSKTAQRQWLLLLAAAQSSLVYLDYYYYYYYSFIIIIIFIIIGNFCICF